MNEFYRIEANVDQQNHLAIVTKQSGKICQHLGQTTKWGKFLYPEEILFLLESVSADFSLNVKMCVFLNFLIKA